MKKVLVISTVQSPPIHSGSQKCIYEYCDLLKRIGVEVHFLFVKGKQDVDNSLIQYWSDNLYIFKRNNVYDTIKRILIEVRKFFVGHNYVDDLYPIGLTSYVKDLQKTNSYNAILINYIILSKLFQSNISCEKILFSHDCMSLKRMRLGVNRFWMDLSLNQEAKGLQRCDTILSIQSNESIYFKYLHPHGKVVTVFSFFRICQQPITMNKNILFLSGNSILNINGIKYFIKEVFPLILDKIPEAQLIIGGSICDVLSNNYHKNIKYIGRVDSEENFYKLGDICINPVYQGTGLKIKTFEALSYGKITIVHPHSAEGIFKQEEAPIFIGNTPLNFANIVVEILSDNNNRQLYSNKAIEYINNLNKYIEQEYRHIMSF